MERMRVSLESDILEIDGETFPHHPNGVGLIAKAAFAAVTAYIAPEIIAYGRAEVSQRCGKQRFPVVITTNVRTLLSLF